jgi:ATP-dependent DNA helicase DinG
MSKEGHEPHALRTFDIAGQTVTLPGWIDEIRPHQHQAIEAILARYAEGYQTVILDAPTGAGKTLIGEVVRQLIPLGSLGLRKALYVCTTRGLQDQFLADFPYARVIKGRANYPTYDAPEAFELPWPRTVNASHCTKQFLTREEFPACNGCLDLMPDEQHGVSGAMHCPNCHPVSRCPYTIAKNQALISRITVANTAYAITEANYVGSLSIQGESAYPEYMGFPFWVVDEAETVEGVLMSFVEFPIGKRALDKAGVAALKSREGVGKPEAWIKWLESAEEAFKRVLTDLNSKLWAIGKGDVPPELLDERARWAGHVASTERVRLAIEASPDNWVLDGYQGGHMIFKPVTVAEYGQEAFWQHSEQQLLMSATPISDWQLASDLGLPEGTWAGVRVDSQFPKERRRVVVMPRADMTNKKKDTEWPRMAEAILQVLYSHPQERVLIHTVSYALSAFLHERLAAALPDRAILTYVQSNQREQVLEKYRLTPRAVLVASSLDRGVDLPDDDTRVIIIAKVPFPNLGDKQVERRFYGGGARGRDWYAIQTVRAMVQMTGRGMRHKDDWVVSYILDAQFGKNVWRNARHFVPKWWADALEWRL